MTISPYKLIGLDKDKAIEILESQGSPYRVVNEISDPYDPDDYVNLSRYNLTISENKVVKVEIY